MSESQITKRVLANSLKDLMQTTPLAKISVGDIAEHCGVGRKTFYYHFKDKYDLVNYIYSTETIDYMANFTDLKLWTDGLKELCLYVRENKKFYINALSTPGQNSFQEYLTEVIHELILSVAYEIHGSSIQNRAKLNFVTNFYTFAFVGLILHWAQHGMKDNPEEYIDSIREIVENGLIKELSLL